MSKFYTEYTFSEEEHEEILRYVESLDDGLSLDDAAHKVVEYILKNNHIVTLQPLLSGIKPGGAESLLLLHNVPIDRNIPLANIGDIETRCVQKGRVSEIMLLAFSHLTGVEVRSNPKEQQGKLVHNVAPHPGYEESKSSIGLEPLAHHTESPQEDNPPDVLMLLGLHGDPQAKTAFVPVHTILNELSPEIKALLQEPLYEIHSGASYMGKTTTSLRPIIADNHLFYIADHERVIPQNEPARNAIADLNDAITTAQNRMGVALALTAGDLVIFNNGSLANGVMHARVGRIEDESRWLQRVLAYDPDIRVPDQVIEKLHKDCEVQGMVGGHVDVSLVSSSWADSVKTPSSSPQSRRFR